MIGLIIAWIYSIYFANATVVGIEEDVIVVETDDGNLWAIDGVGYSVGDNVAVQFHTNYTETVEDDRIMRIYADKE